MIYKKVFFLFSVTLIAFKMNAQEITTKKKKDTTSIGQLALYDVKSTLKSVGFAFTRPLYWKGNDYLKLGGLISGTLLLSAADDEINAFFLRQQDDFPQVVRDFGWYFGSPQNYFMANAGLYGFGLFTRNKKVRRTSVLIISSSITTGLIQSIAKNGFGRARPGTELGAYYFKPFSKESGHHSFPSGHTILSITMAHSIAKQFDSIWTKIGIYSVGAIPPISRLIDGAHWLTDIAFSTAISIIVVDSIDKFLFKNKSHGIANLKSKKISWNVSFGANKIGLTGTF